jgi:hypothetical protein
MIRIKKAKLTNDNKILLMWEETNRKGGWDEYQMICRDKARPTFYLYMKDLSKHVIEMCELPVEAEKIKVRGVTVSYGGDKEVMGATISAEYILKNSNCNLNLNTPHKASDSYSDSPADPMQLLSDECIEDLQEFYEECKAYISGDREQGRLFDELKNMPEFQEMAAAVKSGEVEISVVHQ